MQPFKCVEIPLIMKSLPKDKRGYPIPYIAQIDKNGKPHFTITDEMKRQQVLLDDLCGICGKKLVRFRYLVGGVKSAFMDEGAYLDPPMHMQCAEYALQVCPYIANPSYNKEKLINDKTWDYENNPNLAIIDVNNSMPPVGDLFVMVGFAEMKYVMAGSIVRFVKPEKPYKHCSYWQAGERLNPKEGLALAKELLLPEMKIQNEKEENTK